jgi:hypothetical protein
MPTLLLSQLKAAHALAQSKAFNRESKPTYSTLREGVTTNFKQLCYKRTAARTDNKRLKEINFFRTLFAT